MEPSQFPLPKAKFQSTCRIPPLTFLCALKIQGTTPSIENDELPAEVSSILNVKTCVFCQARVRPYPEKEKRGG